MFVKRMQRSLNARPTLTRRKLLLTGSAATSLLGLSTSQPEASETPLQIAQANEPVDLLLLLAVDCSQSVSRTEYNLQVQGLALAFLDPEVVTSIASGPSGKIAVAVMQWSGEGNQVLAIPWTIIDGPQTAIQMSARLSTMTRQTEDGATALGEAMVRAGQAIDTAPMPGFRKVIDISGDGQLNSGIDTVIVRDRLVERGITINALVILTENPLLDQWFEKHVIGGPGAFTLSAKSYSEYRTAIQKKLVREIKFIPVS